MQISTRFKTFILKLLRHQCEKQIVEKEIIVYKEAELEKITTLMEDIMARHKKITHEEVIDEKLMKADADIPDEAIVEGQILPIPETHIFGAERIVHLVDLKEEALKIKKLKVRLHREFTGTSRHRAGFQFFQEDRSGVVIDVTPEQETELRADSLLVIEEV